MACGRTKAEAIVTDVLAPTSVEDCLKVLRRPLNEQREATTKAHTPFFSVASDASNHGTTKLFPLSVRYWTPDLGVQTKVLDFRDDSDETSVAIHNQIVTKLEENGLGLDMISAYSADNASLNYGRYNSVFQKLKENNNCILNANCVAHIVHNSAKHAGDRLNIDIENVVNKTFSQFSSSAKRIEELKSIHTFVEIEYQSLLRHVPTRWLSLWPAVKRLHDSWASIKTYFLSLGEDQCPKSLWLLFKDDQDGEGNPLDLQFVISPLMDVLAESALYHRAPQQNIRDCPELGVKLQIFMVNFFSSLPEENRGSVLLQLIQRLGSRQWCAVPLLFLSQALSCLSPCPLLGSDGLHAFREVLRCTMITHQVLLRGASQCFLLHAALCLTDVSTVSLDEIFGFLAHFRADESLCRGTALWEELCNWLQTNEGRFLLTDGDLGSSELCTATSDCKGVSIFSYVHQRLKTFLAVPANSAAGPSSAPVADEEDEEDQERDEKE
ncbi:unnamed protein product [Leuciscus chuanchicus]